MFFSLFFVEVLLFRALCKCGGVTIVSLISLFDLYPTLTLKRYFFLLSYEEFYPDPDKRSSAPDVYSRIVTPQATTRVAGLLERTKGTVVFGGEVDKDKKYIAPTVVKDVGPE